MTKWLWVVLVLCGCAPRLADTFIALRDSSADAGEQQNVDAGPRDPDCACTTWGNPRAVGTVKAPLDELSGLTVSRAQQSYLFAHNDSGDTARFFAINYLGELVETFNLTGATARDWEDVASGPCPAGTCLYLGDIGDNSSVRDDYAVYRVTEPNVTSGSTDVAWERLEFQYPNGAHHNAEALLMNPKTGVLYVITKETTAVSEVYRFPLPLDATKKVTLEKVVTMSLPTSADRPLTAGDVNPCGTAVLLRMYNRLVELRLPAGETDFEQVFTQPALNVPVASEAQGEAVAYTPDGRGYVTSSEKLVDDPPVYLMQCR